MIDANNMRTKLNVEKKEICSIIEDNTITSINQWREDTYSSQGFDNIARS
jgi:hypothetical protein